MVEEEAQNNDLTRFERFKQWSKKTLGGISGVALSVAGIITTIIMGARNGIKRGVRVTGKFAKVAKKAGLVIGGLLNPTAKHLAKVRVFNKKPLAFCCCNNVEEVSTLRHLLKHKRCRRTVADPG